MSAPAAPGLTARFLGDDQEWAGVTLRYSDVNGLWGGDDLLLRGDGELQARHVTPAMTTTASRLHLDEEEARGLLRLCVTLDVLAVASPTRPAVPDETLHRLVLTNPAGECRELRWWANEVPAAIAPLLVPLRALAGRAAAAAAPEPPAP